MGGGEGVRERDGERESRWSRGRRASVHRLLYYICPRFQRAVRLLCVSGGFEHVRKVKVSNEKGAFVDDVNLNPPGEFPWKSNLTEVSFAVPTLQFAFSQRCFCFGHTARRRSVWISVWY